MDQKVTIADIKMLENRLWKGDKMCDEETGDKKAELERFWLDLLKQYTDACDRFREQGGRL